MSDFAQKIRPHVTEELRLAAAAEAEGALATAFTHLERAHILGQASTREHVRVHVAMLAWGIRQRSAKEILGQLLQIVGAATKTAIGLVPTGNTGGANVSPVKPMPLPPDLEHLIRQANDKEI